MTTRENSRLVYSSEAGRICSRCGSPAANCRCSAKPGDVLLPARVVVKLRVEKAGRGGKTVTVLYDLPRNAAFLKELSQELKRSCGVGGGARTDAIELQGDVRDRVRELLAKKGYGVKG